MFKKIIRVAFALLAINFSTLLSQQIEINKIEPPNWWAGMKHDTVQLMIYGKNLNLEKVNLEISKF